MKQFTLVVLLATTLGGSGGCCCFRKKETVAVAPVCAPPVMAYSNPCAPACTSAPVTYGMPTSSYMMPMQ